MLKTRFAFIYKSIYYINYINYLLYVTKTCVRSRAKPGHVLYNLPNCGNNNCNFRHLLLNCPALLSNILLNLKLCFSFIGIKYVFYIDSSSPNNNTLIKHILNFILSTGLEIWRILKLYRLDN